MVGTRAGPPRRPPDPSLPCATAAHAPKSCCSTWCLVTSSTWPWKVTASDMPSRCDVVDEPLSPPSVADDVEVQAGYPRPQLRDRLQRVLDLLVRHQPREHHHPRCGRARAGQRCASAPRRDRCAPPRSARCRTPERDQIARRRQRHRHVLVAPVQPRRQRRLDKPAEPAEHRPGHRPLLAMAVVHQHHHPPAVHQPGQERQAVLGVDHDVGPYPPQRPETERARRPSPATPTRRRSSARPRG